ncbi:UNVERIFIED_CONTAM: hypothetical protein FKN15_061087 [Acipenser sinensis]
MLAPLLCSSPRTQANEQERPLREHGKPHTGTRERMSASYRPLWDKGQPCRRLLELTRHLTRSSSAVRRDGPCWLCLPNPASQPMPPVESPAQTGDFTQPGHSGTAKNLSQLLE